ncbi:MAG: hypothetical protein HYU03_05185 [Thaumarchaeota archaeon]|nr:hypothetical protein [Nitrososphaerota archaeon]MBI3022293.1 hypothetical protein [Nitrososphaerota archaeon]MCS4540065.1 hypothetical protein [Nitrososphaerota archaeon]
MGCKIVLKRGLAQVGQDMPELKPVETRPLPPRTPGSQAMSRKRELYAAGIMPPNRRSPLEAHD